jgi:hypothetical protein
VAYVFSPAAARRYLRNRGVCWHRWRSAAGGLAQIDVVVGWWAKRHLVPVWFPTPSLVQHIGEVSTLWLNCRAEGPRAASLFVGTPRPDAPPNGGVPPA